MKRNHLWRDSEVTQNSSLPNQRWHMAQWCWAGDKQQNMLCFKKTTTRCCFLIVFIKEELSRSHGSCCFSPSFLLLLFLTLAACFWPFLCPACPHWSARRAQSSSDFYSETLLFFPDLSKPAGETIEPWLPSSAAASGTVQQNTARLCCSLSHGPKFSFRVFLWRSLHIRSLITEQRGKWGVQSRDGGLGSVDGGLSSP